MNRTIEDLRNTIKGKIYIYLGNEKIGKQFMQDAENEGYRFGKINPTENGWSNIIALEKRKQLSYVGFVGHMNFQCNGGSDGGLTRIDYEKYVNGCKNFIFKNKPLKETTIKNSRYGEINIIGDNCFDAAMALKDKLKVKEDINVDSLCDEIGREFDVLALPEED